MAETPPPNSEGLPTAAPDETPNGAVIVKPAEKVGRLTPKQERFANEWLIDQNATQAAIRAGCPPASAYQTGSRWLRKPQVKAAIREALKRQVVLVTLSAEKTLRETGLIAFSNIADYVVDRGGVVRLAHEGLDPASLRAVKSVKRVERVLRRNDDEGTELVEVTTEIQMHDKMRALQNLMQYHGLLKQPTPAAPDDPIKELLRRLPPEVSGALSALLAASQSGPLAPGNGSPDPEPNGSRDDGSSGVPAVPE